MKTPSTRTYLATFLLTFFVFSSISFAAGDSGSGGASTGGGDFFTPSEQQVVDSVFPATFMVVTALTDFWPNEQTGRQDFGKLIPENLRFLNLEGQYFAALENISLASLKTQPENLNLSLYFKHKGLCPGPDGKDHAGSVSSSNKKFQLCISLEKLTSIPKDYLTEEMAILIAHEATHIAGRGEADAQAVQEWFSNYNKVRLDIGRFTFGKEHSPSSAVLFRLLVNVLSSFSDPSDKAKICSSIKETSNAGFELDRDVKMFKNNVHLDYFKITFPSTDNNYRYWSNRVYSISQLACSGNVNWDVIKKATNDLKSDYETFMQQFGRTVPRELTQ